MEKRELIQKTRKQLHDSQKNEQATEYEVEIQGEKFLVLPNVFSPKYFKDCDFFSQNIPIEKDGSFLEIGSGTGVNAVFAALRGAGKVVATDINQDAASNTLMNVNLHNLADVIDVRHGDLFEPVKGETFDQIFWNVPFLYTENKNLTMLEQSTFDYGDLKKEQFIKEAKDYLTAKGKVYIGYSSDYGDVKKIIETLEKYNYSSKIITEMKESFAGGSINLEIIEAIPEYSEKS